MASPDFEDVLISIYGFGKGIQLFSQKTKSSGDGERKSIHKIIPFFLSIIFIQKCSKIPSSKLHFYIYILYLRLFLDVPRENKIQN